ncbi:hypothetical protein PL263_00710 [Methylomonas sp. EFPC3]|uniref:hypothetical protein n=1 Tax=Methylomonas sp. EFPC3 TaxID=3021710 RepID=UPI0024176A1F|nr:hypothetical protein [Methylomonas sp. EFPC3]WFP50560.1 hypothetical protein PL263_00710 [Methylomonas sp. EFPC3]
MKLRRGLYLFGLLILLGVPSLKAVTRQSLVLVTGSASTIPVLTVQEARKLFLGVPLEKDGERPVPLLNTSDPLIYEVFLQKVAFMSANAYENQTISVVFRLGGKRPESYSDLKDLLAALQQHPGTVTYLWEDQVRANQGIKAVNVLWQGAAE